MKFKLLAAMLVAVLALTAVPAKAENAFTHHIDLFQVSASESHFRVLDFGYHFTAVRFKRVELLGLGVGLDWYCRGSDCETTAFSPFVQVPVFSVALVNPKAKTDWQHDNGTPVLHEEKYPWISFGSNYVYNVRFKEHRITAGFAVSFK